MRIYVITSLLIIVGLASIAYKGHLTAADPSNSLIPYLQELSSALIVGGVVFILIRIFEMRESESTLRRLLRIHDSVDELGLQEIVTESQGYNYTTLIQDSDTLAIIMNDGLRWVGNNTVSLSDRFSKAGTVTEVFTVDPDSPFVTPLAAKTDTTVDDLSKKIRDTWKRLGEIYAHSGKKGQLHIYRLKTFPTKSIFLSEDVLVETPYQTASGRTNVPVFIYRKVARQDAPFWFSTRDIKALRAESKLEVSFPQTTP
jgi:hypothetical protein